MATPFSRKSRSRFAKIQRAVRGIPEQVYNRFKLSELNKDWIINLPKQIDSNNCWIPTDWAPQPNGYIRISIEHTLFSLHRLVMCIDRDLDYYDKSFETRHGEKCDHACFNPSHLQPGTAKENALDAVEHGTNHNTSKERCPKCDGEYKSRIVRFGKYKHRIWRYCPQCS